MSALLGSLEGAAGAGGLTGLAASSVMGELKNDAMGGGQNNPLTQLLQPQPVQAQPQAQAAYQFPQMPQYDPNTDFIGGAAGNVGSIPISRYFVGGKSG